MSDIFKRYDDIFKLAGVPEARISELSDKLREPHRFYHNTAHVEDILSNIEKKYPNDYGKEKCILILLAFFHDAVYDPKRKDNEELSVDFFKNCVENRCDDENSKTICSIIMDTKTHEPSSELSKIFCDLDLYGLKKGSFERVLEDERKIFLEFQRHDYSEYKIGRLTFLESYRKKIENDANVDMLIGYLKFRRPKIGVYAGSFNPIHIGHINVIKKAEKLFDKVIIAKGYNPEKPKFNAGADIMMMDDPSLQQLGLQKKLSYRQVEVFEGFLTDYIRKKSEHADIFVVRGLRNGKDLDYEINQLRVMESMNSFLKMVFIHCDKEYEHISSSAIRAMEKISNGSASHFLP